MHTEQKYFGKKEVKLVYYSLFHNISLNRVVILIWSNDEKRELCQKRFFSFPFKLEMMTWRNVQLKWTHAKVWCSFRRGQRCRYTFWGMRMRRLFYFLCRGRISLRLARKRSRSAGPGIWHWHSTISWAHQGIEKRRRAVAINIFCFHSFTSSSSIVFISFFFLPL